MTTNAKPRKPYVAPGFEPAAPSFGPHAPAFDKPAPLSAFLELARAASDDPRDPDFVQRMRGDENKLVACPKCGEVGESCVEALELTCPFCLHEWTYSAEPAVKHAPPAPAFVHVIAWRPMPSFRNELEAGELRVDTRKDGRVCVDITVNGHPELCGAIESGEAWDLTQRLAEAFGWRLVK